MSRFHDARRCAPLKVKSLITNWFSVPTSARRRGVFLSFQPCPLLVLAFRVIMSAYGDRLQLFLRNRISCSCKCHCYSKNLRLPANGPRSFLDFKRPQTTYITRQLIAEQSMFSRSFPINLTHCLNHFSILTSLQKVPLHSTLFPDDPATTRIPRMC